MKVNQWEINPPHKYLARDFKSDNAKIIINAMIQKICLKTTEYNLAPVGRGGGHNQIKQWLQCCSSDGCGLLESCGPVEI